MQENAIEIHHLWKLFHQQKQRTVKEMLPAFARGGKKNIVQSFWALKDIHFTLHHGESLGIIGANGSGKSTLLKILSHVTIPTKGSFQIRGRVAPLIELGAGFHPEMTGRENIYLNSIILGATRETVTPKIQHIIDFSEIGDFIDQPVKHYSNGMYMRLAFAVAIHTNFDILLVDEILTVGDERFQRKCYQKIEEFKQMGKTIVLVSHTMETIKRFCDRVVYLHLGEQKMFGSAAEVVKMYDRAVKEKNS
jgi:ABC-2 type transport system ATP-binding protein